MDGPLAFVLGGLFGGALFLALMLLLDPVGDALEIGRIQVASGQYECAKDIAGEWRCVEVKPTRGGKYETPPSLP